MKFKISVIAIILSTAVVIGLVNLAISKIAGVDGASAPTAAEKKHKEEKDIRKTHSAKAADENRFKTSDDFDEDEDEDASDVTSQLPPPSDEKKSDDHQLTSEEIQKINSVANLSEAELVKELNSLKTRIEEDDLFDLLEEETLSEGKEKEAKEILERFALLGLEQTRRKYMGVEPELKDALYAHRDSIREIREMLDD